MGKQLMNGKAKESTPLLSSEATISRFIGQRLQLATIQGSPEEQIMAIIAMIDHQSPVFNIARYSIIPGQWNNANEDLVRQNDAYFRDPWLLFETFVRKAYITPEACDFHLRRILLNKIESIVDEIPKTTLTDADKSEFRQNITFARDIANDNTKIERRLEKAIKVTGIITAASVFSTAGFVFASLLALSIPAVGLGVTIACAIGATVSAATGVAGLVAICGLYTTKKALEWRNNSKLKNLPVAKEIQSSEPLSAKDLVQTGIFKAGALQCPRTHMTLDVTWTDEEADLARDKRERGVRDDMFASKGAF